MPSMQEEKSATNAAAWFSLFAGLTAGAVVGVLFAPKAGKEIRANLKDWLKEKREESSHVLLARKARIGAAVNAAKSAYANERETLGV